MYDTVTISDRGRIRENNDDSCFAVDKVFDGVDRKISLGIYIVADGLGGHKSGNIASSMAVQILSETLQKSIQRISKVVPAVTLAIEAIEKANSAIYCKAQTSPELSGMGTTITMGLRINNELYLGHVGDSRAYLIRGKQVRQLTEDHSLVERLMKTSIITRNESKVHPDRGKVYRSVGTTDHVSVDTIGKITLKTGDILIFCTDGLTEYLSGREIMDMAMRNKTAGDICRNLVDMANAGGGEDNISVIAIKVNN